VKPDSSEESRCNTTAALVQLMKAPLFKEGARRRQQQQKSRFHVSISVKVRSLRQMGIADAYLVIWGYILGPEISVTCSISNTLGIRGEGDASRPITRGARLVSLRQFLGGFFRTLECIWMSFERK
jgi:hypothetical protein